MKDETTNLKPIKLFQNIESIFKEIGFKKQQVVTMDITAGSYLVTNPTDDLPRVICSLNEENQLKVEYSDFSKTNIPKFSLFLADLRNNSLHLLEGQLVNASSGSNIEEFEIEEGSDFDYSAELTNIVLEYTEIITNLKFYLTFDAKNAIIDQLNENNISRANSKEEITKRLEFEDEIALILNFISKKSTKCIQSKHLLQLYPESSRKECLQKLKTITERGYLTQSGPWFLLNKK